jgi:hypothetical protein
MLHLVTSEATPGIYEFSIASVQDVTYVYDRKGNTSEATSGISEFSITSVQDVTYVYDRKGNTGEATSSIQYYVTFNSTILDSSKV